MSGFSSNFSNMPPGVGVNDTPGNDPDDIECDSPRHPSSLVPIMEQAVVEYLRTEHPARFMTFITIIFQSGWMEGHKWACKELVKHVRDQLNKGDVG